MGIRKTQLQFLDLKVPPLLVAFVCAAMAVGARYLFPDFTISFRGRGLLAGLSLLAGVAIAVAGVLEFRQARTTVNPLKPHASSSVVSSGVFRFSRNPMYVGMAMAVLAAALWSSSVVGFVAVPLFCVYITAFQIKPEERTLLQLFGEPYGQYMGRVRRWL